MNYPYKPTEKDENLSFIMRRGTAKEEEEA